MLYVYIISIFPFHYSKKTIGKWLLYDWWILAIGIHQLVNIDVNTKNSLHRPISARRYNFSFDIREFATTIGYIQVAFDPNRQLGLVRETDRQFRVS